MSKPQVNANIKIHIVLLFFSTCVFSVSSTYLLSDSNFLGISWITFVDTLQANASFTNSSNGMLIEITNPGQNYWDIGLGNSLSIDGSNLVVYNTSYYKLVAEVKTTGLFSREILMTFDTSYPDWIWQTPFVPLKVYNEWTNISQCFKPQNSSTGRVVFFLGGGHLLNPLYSLQIRYSNLIEVSSCEDEQSSLISEDLSSKTVIYVTAIGLACVALIALIATISVIITKRKTRYNNAFEVPLENQSANTTPSAHSSVIDLPRSPATEIAFEELIFVEQIGEGGCGIVFKGEWRHQIVAISEQFHGSFDKQRDSSIILKGRRYFVCLKKRLQ